MGQNFSLRIIIIESYGTNINSLSGHLAALPSPAHILAVPDAETAIAQVEKEPFDLAIVDVSLRGKMDGFDVCRALRSHTATQGLPIILLLAGHLSLERSKGMVAGADLLLHRPIVKEELVKMVQLLLRAKFEQASNSHATTSESTVMRRLRPVSVS